MKSRTISISRIRFVRTLSLAILVILFPGLFLTSFSYAQTGAISELILVDAVTKREVKVQDYDEKKAVIVIFFCNNCPYSIYYIDRIREFSQDYTNFQFLLVNSSNPEFVPEESEAKMEELIKEHGLEIPYLIDKNKKAKKAFGAKKCPEVFVVMPGSWNVVYKGAIDNNPQVAEDVSEFYLRNVLDEIRQGRQVTKSYERPTGCIIK